MIWVKIMKTLCFTLLKVDVIDKVALKAPFMFVSRNNSAHLFMALDSFPVNIHKYRKPFYANGILTTSP